MIAVILSFFTALGAKEITVTVATEPVLAGRNASIQCSFDLNDLEKFKGLSWKSNQPRVKDGIIFVLDDEGRQSHVADARFSNSFSKSKITENDYETSDLKRLTSTLLISDVQISDDEFDYNCEVTFVDSTGAFHQSDSTESRRLKILRAPSTPYLTISDRFGEAAFECQVDDLGYPEAAVVEINFNGTSLVRQQSSIIQTNLKLDASLKGTFVECRTTHESFDLGLASPSLDELELVAPEISGASLSVSLFLTEKKLTQVPAKFVNIDSALGSGTGVSVKIEKKSQKSCRVLVEMDTDALPIPSLAVFSSQNRTTATPSNDNRSITVNLKKYAPQTVVAAMSPLGSVAFILDDAVYNKCFPPNAVPAVKKSGSSSFDAAIISIFVIVILVCVLLGLVFLKKRRDSEKENRPVENANATMRSVESQDFEAYQPEEQNEPKSSQSESAKFIKPNTSLALSDDDADI
ncbi:unnamed protein product [Oikopleura dioica]|uniref:Ig-like domain-containing protein n=1 Tax=Oikopleura dioica TaxID=34765 RepID=E4XCL5_OIKDI|nr:unnamed protein product [Oikopleura dioica]